ncbi:MAG TPA: HIT family hydrolase, partial [Actinomycetota bacterium]|nr:HIT family hydrolase [Actinomycetota bacterium]
MERLWAPWRMEYIGSAREGKDEGCLFCEKPKEGDDEKALIVARSELSFAMLNRYPYNSGHLMIA